MTRLLTAGLVAALLHGSPARADENTLADRLATASVDAGERVFKRCRSCHTVAEGGPNRNGPNLWGVIGRPVAAAEGFATYSDALSEAGGDWTVDRLDAFLADPKTAVPGTRMRFTGLDAPVRRAELIAFLNANSDAPKDLAAAAPDAPAFEEEPPEFGVLVAATGAEETYAYCTACHSERIVAQQGLTRAGWEELMEWMVDEQGMIEIDRPDLDLILGYLEVNYGTDRPNFPSN